MSLGDSIEELETLDVPRGVVAAANRYAACRVPIGDLLAAFKDTPQAPSIVAAAQKIYEQHFDAFVAGAKWAAKDEPEEHVSDRCGSQIHEFESQALRCFCGETWREKAESNGLSPYYKPQKKKKLSQWANSQRNCPR